MLVRIPTAKVKLIYKPIEDTIVSTTSTDTTAVQTTSQSNGTQQTTQASTTGPNPPTTGTNSSVAVAEAPKTSAEAKEIVIESNLISLQVTNGEGDRTSAVQVVFDDPDLEIDKLFLGRALKRGGIDIPENLLKAPEQETGATAANPSTGNTGTGGSVLNVGGDYQVPPKGTTGDALAIAIIKYCRAIGVNDNSHIAAILGNITIETVMGVYTHEIGGPNKRYAPFYGRGLIQITWENNYRRFGAFFGQDFVNNPDLVAELKWAIPIAVGGMTGVRGCPTFTGRKLSDFGSGNNFDFVGARKTVNGTDKAQLVASESRKWLARIPQLALTPTSAASRIQETYAPGSFDSVQQAKVATEGVSVVPDYAVEIQTELGWSDSEDVVMSSFWFIGRSATSTRPNRVTFLGRGIRYLINQTSRKTYQNASLRQIAERIGTDYGVDTVIPNTPATGKITPVLKQNSETDYNFLLKVAKSNGYTIKADATNPKLTLETPKEGERVKVKAEWKSVFSSSEQASPERLLKELPPIDSLVDGKAIAEGFSTTLDIAYPPLEVMLLKPGTIIVIDNGVITGLPDDSAYCREYKLKAINLMWDGTLKATLDLYIPVNIDSGENDQNSQSPATSENRTATGTPGSPASIGTGKNADVAKEALKWVDREFKPGQTERCADFVRTVLKAVNHPKADYITTAPADGLAISKNFLMAASLSGTDCGLRISDVGSLNPGDLVFFKNTYGNFAPGTITHIGIAAGNGDMIDRSTSAKPVRKRGIIATFGASKFSHGIRLSES
jgi:hypothetical protein